MQVSLSETIAFGSPPNRASPPTSAGQNDAVVWSKANTTRNAAESGSPRHQPEHFPDLAPAHRDADARLPPVGLGKLTRLIGGPLVGPGSQERRPDPAQVILQDG